MSARSRQLYALYLTRFASGFGFITLLTLLPTYIDLFDPSGLVIGMFTTGLTLAQTVAIVPLAWAGDRYDKRQVLLGSLGIAVVAYVAFAFVSTSGAFIGTRALQGIADSLREPASMALFADEGTEDGGVRAASGSANSSGGPAASSRPSWAAC